MNLPCNNWALQERNEYYFFLHLVCGKLCLPLNTQRSLLILMLPTPSGYPLILQQSREVLLRLVQERFMSLLLFHLHLISKYRSLAWLHASVLHQNSNVMCWVYWCERASEPFPGVTAALGSFSFYYCRPAWSTVALNDVCAQRMRSGLIIMKSEINNWQTRQLEFWADYIHFPEELLHKRHNFFFFRPTSSACDQDIIIFRYVIIIMTRHFNLFNPFGTQCILPHHKNCSAAAGRTKLESHGGVLCHVGDQTRTPGSGAGMVSFTSSASGFTSGLIGACGWNARWNIAGIVTLIFLHSVFLLHRVVPYISVIQLMNWVRLPPSLEMAALPKTSTTS